MMFETLTNILKGFLICFMILYASLARPVLPDIALKVFANPFFRLFMMAIIVFMSVHNVAIAIIISIVYMVSMSLLHEQTIAEGFLVGLQSQIPEGFVGSAESESESEGDLDLDDIENEEADSDDGKDELDDMLKD